VNSNEKIPEPDIQKITENIPVYTEHSNEMKEIERIVILYKNKTFITYQPE